MAAAALPSDNPTHRQSAPADCCICMESTGPSSVSFTPCGHGTFCAPCGVRLHADAAAERRAPACPLCRAPIARMHLRVTFDLDCAPPPGARAWQPEHTVFVPGVDGVMGHMTMPALLSGLLARDPDDYDMLVNENASDVAREAFWSRHFGHEVSDRSMPAFSEELHVDARLPVPEAWRYVNYSSAPARVAELRDQRSRRRALDAYRQQLDGVFYPRFPTMSELQVLPHAIPDRELRVASRAPTPEWMPSFLETLRASMPNLVRSEAHLVAAVDAAALRARLAAWLRTVHVPRLLPSLPPPPAVLPAHE